jgi:hypothetical protein
LGHHSSPHLAVAAAADTCSTTSTDSGGHSEHERRVCAGTVGSVSEGWRNPWFTERHDDTRPVVTAGLTGIGFHLGLFIGTLHSGMGEQLRRPSSVSGPPWIMGLLCVLLCCGSIDTHKDRCSCSIGSFDYCWLAHWFLDRAWRPTDMATSRSLIRALRNGGPRWRSLGPC